MTNQARELNQSHFFLLVRKREVKKLKLQRKVTRELFRALSVTILVNKEPFFGGHLLDIELLCLIRDVELGDEKFTTENLI